jgi:hypothetical protein
MTPAAKITYSLALLIGLSIGAFFGFRWTTPLIESYYSARQLTAPLVLRHFSYLQYKHADYEHAKAALQTCANFLEEMEDLKPDAEQKRALAITYMTLAVLEETANDPEQSSAYMSRARLWYTADGGREYSDSEMKSFLKQIDVLSERIPW